MSVPITDHDLNRYYEALQELKERKDVFFDRAKEVAKLILKFFGYTDTKDYSIVLDTESIKKWIEDEKELVSYHVEECSRNQVFWDQYDGYLKDKDTWLKQTFSYMYYFPSSFLFIPDNEIINILDAQQKEKDKRVSERRKNLAKKKDEKNKLKKQALSKLSKEEIEALKL